MAETGQNGFTGFGNGPSINDAGKVAFIAKFANGDSVFAWNASTGLTDIATNFRSSTRSFGEGAQINDNDEVVTWSRILGATPIGEIRTFRATGVNDSTVMVRALPGFFPNSYDTLFQFPAINNTKLLEDRSQGGNLDGICGGGEVCVSQIAYGAFRAADSPPRYLGTVVKNPKNGADFGQYNEFALNTSLSRPAISDEGRVAVRGRNPTDPIQLFDYNLASHIDIAKSADGFTALGLAPGITDDGRIVAFAGNRGEGDGVFLSMQLPNGNRRLVRIVGENQTVLKSELGRAGNGNKLYFSSIELDSRVGVTYTPDYDGNARGSVVVTFIGTPNGASRTNPGTNAPFIFSAQKGLWSIRIDLTAALYENACVAPSFGNSASTLPTPTGGETVAQDIYGTHFIKVNPANGYCQTENDYQTDTLFSRTSPLPVVQIGDTFRSNGKTYTVSAISVNDPVAAATSDSQLQPRSARLGDHRVVFWAQAGADQIIVSAEHLDSDQDGLLDHWETDGIDLQGNGTIDLDLKAMGADPFKRDLFVQMDFGMDRTAPLNIPRRHEPAPAVLRQFVQHFAAAPALASGVQAGITLHIDAGSNLDRAGQVFSRNMGAGPLRGGKVISKNGAPIDLLYFGLPGSVTLSGVNAEAFDTVKVNNFWSSHRGARELAFLYIVFADFHHALDGSANDSNTAPMTGTATGSTKTKLFDINNNSIASKNFGGHAIKITGGTGAGQLRTIAASGLDLMTNQPVVIVNEPWAIDPDPTSTYITFDGSAGEGNAGTRTDGAFLPGRSLAITLGGYLTFTPDLFQGNFRDEWQTLAHETGHLLTLMHGGINHNNYKPNFLSLMNYAYENCPPGRNGAAAGAAPCPIDRYSLKSDKVFSDWDHIDLKGSLNFGRLTQAFGKEPDENPPNPPPPETRTMKEILDLFGPLDYTAPTVTISTPANGATIAQGAGMSVSFTATDDVAVARAEVHFDVNGDGVIDEATEIFAATAGGGGSFTAVIPAVSGSNGVRMLTVFAYDTSDNPGYSSRTINIGAAASINVPSVIGQTQAAASAVITNAGLAVGTITQQASQSVPAGQVISQSPASGTSVSSGSAVNLVVSTGAASISVPNVIGQTQASASTAITNTGLTVGTVTQQASQSVPAGQVISQSPASGTSVSSGSAVNLVVSTGAAAISVPNVIGQTQASASTAITSAGLTVGTVTQQASQSVPAGQVISQSPASGTSVSSGS
ncbi:MAG: PASTA domain-containing protein, partial [Pseudomonadota bacterium]|nr:PASTA domain-containing protein [Pseudomonadota bacterium]